MTSLETRLESGSSQDMSQDSMFGSKEEHGLGKYVLLIPISGTILTSPSALWMTLLNMMNMTVAMMLAAVVVRALRKAKKAMGKVAQRV